MAKQRRPRVCREHHRLDRKCMELAAPGSLPRKFNGSGRFVGFEDTDAKAKAAAYAKESRAGDLDESGAV